MLSLDPEPHFILPQYIGPIVLNFGSASPFDCPTPTSVVGFKRFSVSWLTSR